MMQLTLGVYLEAAYQFDMINAWGWLRFTRQEWSENLAPFEHILCKEAHAAISAWALFRQLRLAIRHEVEFQTWRRAMPWLIDTIDLRRAWYRRSHPQWSE